MKIKILYIHGFGSNGESQTAKELQDQLGEKAEVYSPQFIYDLSTYEDFELNISQAKKIARDYGQDVVIGSSFGGFIASFLHGHYRILINPCLLPSERLQILSPRLPESDIEKLRVLEHSIDIDLEVKYETRALFGLQDELFSYLDYFRKNYGNSNLCTMNGGHRMNPESIKRHLIPMINKVLEDKANFNPNQTSDGWYDGIEEDAREYGYEG